MSDWIEMTIKFRGPKQKPTVLFFRKVDVLMVLRVYRHKFNRFETWVRFKAETGEDKKNHQIEIPADCTDKLRELLGAECDTLEVREESPRRD